MDSNKLKESINSRIKDLSFELAQIDGRAHSLREELQVQNGYLKMLNQLDGTEPAVLPKPTKAPRPAGAPPLGRPRKPEAEKKTRRQKDVSDMVKLPFAIQGAELCAKALEMHGPLGFADLGRAAYPGRPNSNVWLAMKAKPEWFEQPGGRGTKWQLSEAGRNRPKVEMPVVTEAPAPAAVVPPANVVVSPPVPPQQSVSSPFPVPIPQPVPAAAAQGNQSIQS